MNETNTPINNTNTSVNGMNTYYVNFDSQFRNRNIYQSPCHFSIDYGKNQDNIILDEVCDGVPFAYINFESTVIATQNIYPIAKYDTSYYPYYNKNNGSGSFVYKYNINKLDNFHNIYLTMFDTNVFKIESYCKELMYGYVSANFTEDPLKFNMLLGDSGIVTNNLSNLYCKNVHSNESGTALNIAGNSIQLAVTSSIVDDYYKNWWIWFGANSVYDDEQIKAAKIISYDGATQTAIVNKLLTNVNMYYELSNRVHDSHRYSAAPITKNGLHNYTVRLLLLTLPNKPIVSSTVSQLAAMSGVYVSIGNNDSPNSQNKNMSNNDTKGLFYTMIRDLAPFTGSPYFDLIDCYMKCEMQLDLSLPLYFSVYDTDGNLLKFVDDDLSPFPPNRYGQVNALFQIKIND